MFSHSKGTSPAGESVHSRSDAALKGGPVRAHGRQVAGRWVRVSAQECQLWPFLSEQRKGRTTQEQIIGFCVSSQEEGGPLVESSLVFLEEGVCYDQCVLLAKLY